MVMNQNEQRRPTILVTGGAGFIGSHLCERLVKDANVICLDNFITGHESNIDHLFRLPAFKFIRHDLSKSVELETLPELQPLQIKYEGIQEIYHLACPTAHKELGRYTVETALANSHATQQALRLAAKYHSKFLLTSTSSVYGDPLEGQKTFSERYWGFIDPMGPRAPYNEGKRFAEMLVKVVGDRHQLDYKIARIFNTYGPRMMLKDGRRIPDMIEQAANGQPIKIYGDGEEALSYLYIDDLIDGLLRLMNSEAAFPINFGNPNVFTDREIAEKIIAMLESKSTLLFRNALPYISKPAIPDIGVAEKELNWFPIVDIDAGLKKVIEYHLGKIRQIKYEKFHEGSQESVDDPGGS